MSPARLVLLLSLATGCASGSVKLGEGGVDSGSTAMDADGDGYSEGEDCDDSDANANPGAPELCDEVDNDCDGSVDEDVQMTVYLDVDGDGYGTDVSATGACEPSGDYAADGGDCDDGDALLNPGAEEICDGVDNDCNDVVDDSYASDAAAWYPDSDDDGFGDPDGVTNACSQPTGYIEVAGDCDDGNAAAYPEGIEVCDEADNDCDGTVDEDDAEDAPVWYADTDGDGFGDDDSPTRACAQPTGFVDNNDDCNDGDETILPGGDEYCDGIDNDCDGERDEDDAVDAATWYADEDGDGYGDPDSTTAACELPSDFSAYDTDCDDGDEEVHPGADEYCNDIDDDCDGTVDEADAVDAPTWYVDDDGDGYGDDGTTVAQCEQPTGYSASNDDCDDGEGAIHPDAGESCDPADVDEDCDGLADDEDSGPTGTTTMYADTDGDGYGDLGGATSERCDAGSGYVDDDSDCDDDDADVSPAGTEVCDAFDVDENCDGLADDDDDSVTGTTTYYTDADSDGYGDADAVGVAACARPSGTVINHTDCDDSNRSINPRATEVCDDTGTDEDCDGLVNDDDSSVTGTGSWYVDDDGDGYGDDSDPGVVSCWPGSGYVADDSDCDDADGDVNPDADEVCDGSVDEDCNGLVDDDDPGVTSTSIYFPDSDGDGFGDDSDPGRGFCTIPTGYSRDSSDCDDDDDGVNPDASEVCDPYDVDEDCNGVADSADSAAAGRVTMYVDADGDGYGDASATGAMMCDDAGYSANRRDCDDDDASISPRATEVCDAADTDEDCDGLADDADSSATGKLTYYRDLDGDGYGGSGSSTTACDPPSGYGRTAGDCNDTNASINPGASEVCDSLDVDEDCDGLADDSDSSVTGTSTWYPDSDSDGYGDESSSGTRACSAPTGTLSNHADCDDGDVDVNPGATEINCDGIDNDCDGVDAACRLSGDYNLGTDSDLQIVGETAGDEAGGYYYGPGSGVNCAGDVNGDGIDDVIVGASGYNYDAGAAYVVLGTETGVLDLSSADAMYSSSTTGDRTGVAVDGAGDTDGDGYDDIIVGAYLKDGTGYYDGAAYVVEGPHSGRSRIGTSGVTLLGETSYTYAGLGVSGAGDINDDGYDDVIVGAPYYSSYTGRAYLIYGPIVSMDLDAADTIISGATTSYFGRDVVGAGDVNGDGHDDLFIGAGYYSTYRGAGYLFLGPTGSTESASTADAVYTGASTYDYAGYTVDSAGDVNDDGYMDLFIGARGAGNGTAYLILGSSSPSSSSLSSASAALQGESGSEAGVSVAGVGDNDGDGYGDLLVGGYSYNYSTGAAYLVYGPVSGTVNLGTSADASFYGGDYYDYVGVAVGSAGDFSGDGMDDFIIGAGGEDSGGSAAGSAYVIFSGG